MPWVVARKWPNTYSLINFMVYDEVIFDKERDPRKTNSNLFPSEVVIPTTEDTFFKTWVSSKWKLQDILDETYYRYYNSFR